MYADKLLARDPENYRGLLMKAACEFELHGHLERALALVLRCEGNKESSWKYSEAFLYACSGRLDPAYRAYMRAFGMERAEEVAVEVEDFIGIHLEKHPDRVELLFCLGLINLRGKGDANAARRDLKRFLDAVPAGRYVEQQRMAERWLNEIKEGQSSEQRSS